jgi:hypothetical protein
MSNSQQNTGNGHAPGGGIGQRVDQIGSDAQQLWTDARGAVLDFNESLDLRGRLERNPYATLAAAFGVGYVLGGGLFTPLTGRLIRLGLRLAALPLVKDELLHMAETALHGMSQAREQASAGGDVSSGPTA